MEKHPNAALRVYALWTMRLPFDARQQWDTAGLSDPRVVHLWDADNLAGDWFVEHVDGYAGSDWDTYLLFDERATWAASPSPLLGSGSSILAEKETLANTLLPLLENKAASG